MPPLFPLPLDDRTCRLIDAAVAAANRGRFVSAEAMHARRDNWGEADELAPPEPDIEPP